MANDVVIFNQPYNICPRFPQGTKWEVSAKGHRFSCSWNMETFEEAIRYLRDQYVRAVKDAKACIHPGDQYSVTEFSGSVKGPGGLMDWYTICNLVTR